MKSFKIDMFDKTEVNINLSENFHNTFADGKISINRNLCDWQNAKAIIKSSRFKQALKELNIEIIHSHNISAMKTNSENWSWNIRWKKVNE